MAKTGTGRGGARPGSGRPRGVANKKTLEEIEKAAQTGLLPHEILLAIARGDESIFGRPPVPVERIEAAKSAAPYYAAKLSSIELVPTDGDGNTVPLVQVYMPDNGRS